MNRIKKNNCGWLEVICGPMFSGKTEELLRRLNRLNYASIEYIIFKPLIDHRSPNLVSSRNGSKKNAIEIKSPFEIYNWILKDNSNIKVVAIDEVQFFDSNELMEVVDNLKSNGIIIYASGLDNDFRNVPFKTTSLLLSKAEKIQKLSAVCTICGCDGYCTQRIVGNEPADFNEELVKIGDLDSYTARCFQHHEVPNKPISDNSKKFNTAIKQRNI